MMLLRETEMLAVLAFVGVLFVTTNSHPQCLDYGAPFKIKKQLSFCPSYSEYGCCSHQRDSQIASTFRKISSLFQFGNETKCGKILKEVLCLECHPYAAHIFASEGNTNFNIETATPGLCGEFCHNLFNACSNVIQNYFWREGRWISKNVTLEYLNKKRSINRREFCSSIKLSDEDYCYPNVQTIDKRILGRKYNRKSNKGCVCAEKLATSLRNPLAAMHAGDGSNRFFVAEQLGLVHVFLADGKRLKQPFLDIRRKVLTSGRYGDERGFLGLAFHPNFSSNGRVFVYYSSRSEKRRHRKRRWNFIDHKSVLSEYRVLRRNPNRVNHRSEKIILGVDQPEDNHNGGMLMFGLDGYLYLSLGDGGAGGDPFGDIGNGLNRSTLLGSIIRIDVNTEDGSPYKIPPDNPFVNNTRFRPEIYAYGARNMWRCSIDRGDKDTGEGRGRIFCGDVGQNRYEEIDIITKGGNYGWRAFEGYKCYDRKLCKGKIRANHIRPIYAYSHRYGGKSVVGGYVYRGCRNPNLYGKYIFADTWTGEMFQLTENKKRGRWRAKTLCLGNSNFCTDGLESQMPQFILSFGEDEQGELYVLATSSPSASLKRGNIYRLVDPARRGDPTECGKSWFPFPGKKICKDRFKSSPRVKVQFCERWRRRGRCKTSEKFMRKGCSKTCNFC